MMKWLHPQIKKYLLLALTGFIIIRLMIIPVRLAIASAQAPQPQAILMLGGTILGEREKFTAEFAQWYPSLEIWVSSSELDASKVRKIFQDSRISDQRLHLDYRAVDTVTNFTTLVSVFQKRHIQHIYLITSNYHIPRAKAIAAFILSSKGILFTTLSVPSNTPNEPIFPLIRDVVRSLVWIFTGYTGVLGNLK